MIAPFSAALFAGGASRRMGRDKAVLPLPDGTLLWERQWRLLASLGPDECLLSISATSPLSPPPGGAVVHDAATGQGPLAALVACLRQIGAPRLLVLGVDLPRMSRRYLHRLLAHEGGAVFPWGAHGYETLAAIYPREALPLAERALRAGQLSLQALAADLVSAGLAVTRPILPEEEPCFANTNTPAEWEALLAVWTAESRSP